MYTYKGTSIDFCVTPSHNLLIKDKKKNEEGFKLLPAEEVYKLPKWCLKSDLPNYQGRRIEKIALPSTWNTSKKKFSFSLDSLYKLSKFFNKTFIIVPNEPIKMFNAFQDIELQNSEYEKEFLDFLRDPDNELILRLAKVIKDTNSLDNFAVKTIFEQYKKKS